MPVSPQDHKPRKGAPFRFTDKDGKPHTLPPVAMGRSKLTGRDLRDAALGGDIAWLAYLIKALEVSGATEKALDALYAMSQEDMMEVLSQWGDSGDGDGASLGE